MNYIILGITLIAFSAAMINESKKNWWIPSGIENFDVEPPKVEHPSVSANTYGDANIYNDQPYHLLNDYLTPPRMTESISNVNSRSCYASDFERMISKTGNYSQMTNNYKRGYPDSCSSPYQELVLNFYKADPMKK
jgi:hypothetical protein